MKVYRLRHKLILDCDQMGRSVRAEFDKVGVSQGLESHSDARRTGYRPGENEKLTGEL